jgi:hypothetical protein
MRIPKTVRNTFLSVMVLLIIFIGVGAAYTYLGGDESTPPQTAVSKPEVTPQQMIKPVMQDPNGPVGVAIGALTTPVRPGANASIQVRTHSGAKCDITVTYDTGISTDSGLVSKTADEYGVAAWSWTVGSNVADGKYPVNVACAYNGRSGVGTPQQEVSRTAEEL